jgi:hypothetical protein
VGLFADECGQDFHHCGVSPGRFADDAFQGVDAADAYTELSRAELFDRFDVAVDYQGFSG